MTGISMIRPHMDSIPDHGMPDGYTMRPYQSGDMQHWLDFHIPLFPDGDISEDLFWRDYGRDETVLAERQFYMMHGETVMGTISAWFGDDDPGKDWGRIHWVVLHEDYRGKGLAKPLLSFAMNKLKAFGHTQAYLLTHTDLIPAINLYRQFGFEAEIKTEQDQQAWNDVFKQLKTQ